MGLLNKLFGGSKKTPPAVASGPSVAPAPDHPGLAAASQTPSPHSSASAADCSLQVLYARPLELLAEDIRARLQTHHATLADAVVETRPRNPHQPADAPDSRVFRITWSTHVIDLAFLDIPMPAPVVDTCLQGAFFSEDLKREASHHEAHALLWYAGSAVDKLEQMVAVALAAGALARADGLAVLNENGCTAASVAMVCGPEGVDPLEHLQQLPIPMLYAGVKIFQVPHQAGAWARTYGCGVLGLPDLAVQILTAGTGEEHLMLISRVLAELAAAKTMPVHGAGMQLDPTVKIIFHQPHPDDYWLASPDNPLFVLEITVTSAAADSPPPTA